MAERLTAEQMQLYYPSQSGERAKYFSIKEDKGTRRIRFLYNDLNDVFFDVVHEVRVNNRTVQIQCLNPRGEDPNTCPLCAKGHYQKVVLFIPVLDVDTNEVLIWTRSKAWLQQIQGLMMRNNPLSGTVFEIMRLGEKGNMKTQYIPQPISVNDGQTVQQLLQALNTTLPDPSTYMKIMEYGEMAQYAANLEQVSGNIPVNRSANTGYAQPAGNYYNQAPTSQANYGVPAPNYGAPAYTAPTAPTYAPTQPMTPPAAPIQAPVGNRNLGSEPVRRVPQTMPNPSLSAVIPPTDDELPF